jgi:hypothetical protein
VNLNTVLLTGALVGVHLNVHLYLSESLFIPGFVALCFAAPLLFLNRRWVKRSEVKPLLGMVGVAMLATVCVPSAGPLFGERVKGLAQLCTSLFVAYAVLLSCRRCSTPQISRLFLGYLVAILIGCLLETYTTGFRAASDRFREIAFRAYVYDADGRDVALHGRVRPKLFASEPSYLAITFVVCLFVWHLTSTRRFKGFWFAAFFGIGAFLIRSPILVVALPISFLGMDRSRSATRATPRIVTYSVIAVLTLGLILAASHVLLRERILLLQERKDDSFVSRVTGPACVAARVLCHYPLFGVGVEAKEFALPIMEDVYDLLGFSIDRLTPEHLTNYFFLLWIYFGLVGGWLLLRNLDRLRVLLGVRRPALLYAWLFLLAQTTGAMVGARVWTHVFLSLFVFSRSPAGPGRPRGAAGTLRETGQTADRGALPPLWRGRWAGAVRGRRSEPSRSQENQQRHKGGGVAHVAS